MKTPTEVGCKCESCPFAVKGGPRPDFVPAEGDAATSVGVVWCDVPTYDDAKRRTPMTPQSNLGREWGKCLTEAGLQREDLLHIPATACIRPTTVKEGKTAKAVAACAPWRDQHKIEGKPQLMLGPIAMLAATGQSKGFKGRRGFVEDGKIVTFRAEMALFWQPKEMHAFRRDCMRFGRAIRGELAAAPQIAIEITDFQACMDRIDRERLVAFDIETTPETPEESWTGKDPTRARLRTISFGWADAGYAFLWETLGPTERAAVKRRLEAPDILKVGMNIVWFDNRVLARYGMNVRSFVDCRDLRRAVSTTSKLSLAYQTAWYTDAPPWKAYKDEDSEDSTK